MRGACVLAAVLLIGVVATAERLQPEDLVYRGAFRLPGPSGGSSWEYSGDALTYHPTGDPSGPADGYPGSLFGIGHDWEKQVSEIDIPVPVISPGKRLADLPRARTRRPFRDVRAGVGQLERLQEIPRVGLEYLPPQGAQTSGKLYLCWGAHFQEDPEYRVPSHMWCDVTLDGSRGAWRIGSYSPYSVNDYLFEIPPAWASAHTPGLGLATGRFRDGGWGGQGPALFACGPWNHGNPPPDGAVLDATPLLLYSSTATDSPPYHTLTGYHHSDEWAGGAWLTTGDRSAVVFVGTKGEGDCWYGLPDGTVWPEEPPYPPDPLNQRGWWSTRFVGRMIFYDPDDLAAVAAGTREPFEPQPYAALNLDPQLFAVRATQQKHHVGDVCFDRARGLLYAMEPFADGERPLVHVWSVGSGQAAARPDALIRVRGETDWRGGDVYGTNGAGQTSRTRAFLDRSAAYQLRVENDGAAPARLRIAGTGGDAGWQVRYGALGADVTSEVTGSGWRTPVLPRGGAVTLALRVRPLPGTLDRARKPVRVLTSVVGGWRSRDVVRAVTTATIDAAPARLVSLSALPTREGAQLVIALSGPAQVEARVLNVAGRLVRTLCRERPCDAGTTTLLWDGRSDTGLRAPPGLYLVEVTVSDPSGSTSRALAPAQLNR
ncbi:MAG: hypothetical protein FJX74_09400 [Armatimonadetes bacterium]|nr:hypothetical protein [Armatimonadota bacterium]